VGFARVLVHKPEWIFMDEATSALDEAGQENVMKLLIAELPQTSIVSIGHRPGLEAFHTRELTLEPGTEGARPADSPAEAADARCLSPPLQGEPRRRPAGEALILSG
jgi:putative ATP-binding cassette transporter